MYMPPFNTKSLKKHPVIKAARKTVRKYGKEIAEKGLVRATQDRISAVGERVSASISTASSYFKQMYDLLKREWKSLRSPVDKARSHYLAHSISTVQEAIHERIHGEEVTFANIRSLAADKDTKRDVLQSFRWHYELMGRNPEEEGFEEAVRKDDLNLIVINYLVETLCENLPSFTVFHSISDSDRRTTTALIQAKIDKCVSGIDEMAADHVDTPSTVRPVQGHYRISPNANMEQIKGFSESSAKNWQNKDKKFKKMRSSTAKNLKLKQDYVDKAKAQLQEMKKKKQAEAQAQAPPPRGRGRQDPLATLPSAPAPSHLNSLMNAYRASGPISDGEIPESPRQKPAAGARKSRGRGRKSPSPSPQYSPDSPYQNY